MIRPRNVHKREKKTPMEQYSKVLKSSLKLDYFIQIFLGNEDRNTEQKNAIYEGILAKSLRIVGKTSHNKFCLRAELYGVMMTPG